jgi:uncharacterized protein involved in exopolysaccharide biosynthesis
MNEQYTNPASDEQEIDLIELVKKIWSQRRFIYKVCGVAAIVALVIAFSMPKEYKTTVILAPGNSSNKQKEGIGQLVAMAGVSLQSMDLQDLSPDIYPDIVKSTPFLMGLFDVQVKDKRQNINTSLYAYLAEHQRNAWWSYILSSPFKLLEVFFPKQDFASNVDVEVSKIIHISKEQSGIIKKLGGRINIFVAKKTGIITLSCTMQSSEISALVADTITFYMQNYIISYRTEKACQDLAFTEQLYKEAQTNFYKAQQTYATYTDENVGTVSARYRTTQERLQNEMNLAYGVYNQMAQQLQMAKVKVQDTTPVYRIVQPAVVPLKADSPKKKLILIGFVVLGLMGGICWILVKDFFYNFKL